MIRNLPRNLQNAYGLPRTRGDNPDFGNAMDSWMQFAPHARVCLFNRKWAV